MPSDIEYKQISALTEATTISNNDLFVVQQGSTAKKVTGATFLAMVQAHGGISTIVFNANNTMTITASDGTTWTSGVLKGVDGIYPIVSTVAWNSEVRAGSVTPSVTLPTPPTTTTAELRYIFTASGTSASFTAPSGYILGGDEGFTGLSAGNTLSLTVTAGKIYECSFAVLDSTHIGMYMKEWAV